jgi:hypothetical protein
MLAAGGYAGWRWLDAHPQHNPWAPLALDAPMGWATAGKLVDLAQNGAACRSLLARSGVDYAPLPRIGEGACVAADRTRFADNVTPGLTIRPAGVAPSCAVGTAMILWMRERVQPAAMRYFGQRVARIEHLGSYNCRTIRGGGTISQHASGNAIDIAAFVLADGTRVTLKDDWTGEAGRAAFLRAARDGGCALFATTLSPDYNAAHADHFHFDMADRMAGWSVCR